MVPSGTSRLRSSTATCPPKALVTFSIVTAALTGASLALLGEQPAEHFCVAVGRVPGVVGDAGVEGKAGVRARFLQGADHVQRSRRLDGAVLQAVEDPQGDLRDPGRVLFVGSAADG